MEGNISGDHKCVVIICPVTQEANNGNWRTALRWQRLLQTQQRKHNQNDSFQVRIAQQWPSESEDASNHDQVMIALHARRSAPAIKAWFEKRGSKGLIVVLTGTDIYPDIRQDPIAMQSISWASSLVVLQSCALQAIPMEFRSKTRVIVQSCGKRRTLPKTKRHLRVVMVGHLREVKNPRMLLRAAQIISPGAGIFIDHIGEALDPALGEEAKATEAACPHYRWLSGLSHDCTLGHIQRAHLLVHTSHSEGGALVIPEAIRCGTPVLATKIDGNVGFLGEDYEGLVEPNNAEELARQLLQCRIEQQQVSKKGTSTTTKGLLAILQQQCKQRALLFDPTTETTALSKLIQDQELLL
jgi:putative glycosyltransferase (TIGR04348 family)